MGVSGCVTFQIRAGVYDGGFTISNSGQTPSDSIVFRSFDNHVDSVIIRNVATDSVSNFAVKLDGASNVSFGKLTFNSSNIDWSTMILLTNGASNNRVYSCELEAPLSTNNNASAILINDIESGFAEDYNYYQNNTFKGGAIGISVIGEVNNKQEGTRIENNQFLEQGFRAIEINKHANGYVKRNTITYSQNSYAVQIAADSLFYFDTK